MACIKPPASGWRIAGSFTIAASLIAAVFMWQSGARMDLVWGVPIELSRFAALILLVCGLIGLREAKRCLRDNRNFEEDAREFQDVFGFDYRTADPLEAQESVHRTLRGMVATIQSSTLKLPMEEDRYAEADSIAHKVGFKTHAFSSYRKELESCVR